jgi:hypothetical protein
MEKALMKIKTSNAIPLALLCVLAATFVAGCEGTFPSGRKAEKMEGSRIKDD